MRLDTWARGPRSSFSICAADFQAASGIEQLKISVVSEPDASRPNGTIITLTDLNQDLAFPDPDRLRQLLLQDYGREDVQADMRILVIGGAKGAEVRDRANFEPNTELPVYDQLIARTQLEWLLEELGR